jgi:hypothetical protein
LIEDAEFQARVRAGAAAVGPMLVDLTRTAVSKRSEQSAQFHRSNPRLFCPLGEPSGMDTDHRATKSAMALSPSDIQLAARHGSLQAIERRAFACLSEPGVNSVSERYKVTLPMALLLLVGGQMSAELCSAQCEAMRIMASACAMHGMAHCHDAYCSRQHLQAIAARKHNVKDNQTESAAAGKEKPVLARLSEDDFVALGLQSLLQSVTDFWFVFDDQDLPRVYLLPV